MARTYPTRQAEETAKVQAMAGDCGSSLANQVDELNWQIKALEVKVAELESEVLNLYRRLTPYLR
jgi:hypothetical protein